MVGSAASRVIFSLFGRFEDARSIYGCIKCEAWLREARDNNNSWLEGSQHAAYARDSNPWAICTERRKIRGTRATAIESLSPLFWIGQTRFVEEDSQR